MATVWVHVERCTGCGTCVDICPAAAIVLVEDKARVDETRCRGCEACIDACPVGAIQPVIEVQAIPVASDYPIPQRSAPPVAQSATPLREEVVAALTTIGTGLALRAAQAIGRWLLRSPISSPKSVSDSVHNGHVARYGGRQQRRRHQHRLG